MSIRMPNLLGVCARRAGRDNESRPVLRLKNGAAGVDGGRGFDDAKEPAVARRPRRAVTRSGFVLSEHIAGVADELGFT